MSAQPVAGDGPVRLADLTTMRVGGPATRAVTAVGRDEVVETARQAWAEDEPLLVLGGGSNVVVGDGGFDGTVLVVATRGVERLPDTATAAVPVVPASDADRLRSLSRSLRPPVQRKSVRIRVQAGEPWDALCATAVESGWGGIEALSGIPGSCGGAPIQNIGAYGQELAATLAAVEFLDRQIGAVRRIPASELRLGYRTSVFKQGLDGVVLSIDLVLHAAEAPGGQSAPVAYAQLADALGVPLGTRVPVAAMRDTVLQLRRRKGMVLDPADPESVGVGSFFTNPIVSERFARSLPAAAPRWPTAADEPDVVVPLGAPLPERAPRDGAPQVKLSAAWLIEHAGIRRGFRLPGSAARVSSKHTLALVNGGGATAEQVLELARYIRNLVQIEFGVLLQPEPRIVGATL